MFRKIISLNGEPDDYGSKHKQMRVFACPEYVRSRDILSIGFNVFKLEKIIKESKTRNYRIGRFQENNTKELEVLISNLISFVLLERVNIDFYTSQKKYYKKGYNDKIVQKGNAICLFSGGIDSLAGIKWSKSFHENVSGLFCAHSDQARSIHIVNELTEKILKKFNTNINTIHVPEIKKGGYSQLRGFLYILSAGAWLELNDSDSLVLSECGPTMFQPRFGPFDSVTMTTNPYIVDVAHKILNILLGRRIKIYLPFQNMTKAEVIAYISDHNEISDTHSCVTQRFGNHDGTCYGCIIRRLGAIVADKADVQYINNPLIDNKSNLDNLISLLLFSQDLLLSYHSMPLYQIENIETFQQYDLFYRFALDNIAAVHLLKIQGKKLIREVTRLYKEYIDIKGTNELEGRIEAVRNRKFKINENPKF